MSAVLKVNAENWKKQVLQSDVVVLVDFWHKQCSWCSVLEPVFNEVAEEYKGKVKFAKFDVFDKPENREIAVKYGILGTPTLVFFCEGRPIKTTTGVLPKDELKQLVDNVIEKHQECVAKSTELEL